MSETTYDRSLGDYEKEVLLCLDTALTNEQAQPLMRGVVALKLSGIVSDCHLDGHNVEICVASIELLRLELLQGSPCSMLKQQHPT